MENDFSFIHRAEVRIAHINHPMGCTIGCVFSPGIYVWRLGPQGGSAGGQDLMGVLPELGAQPSVGLAGL